MLVFEERGKPEFPEKNLSEQSREPTNSDHIWRPVRESNPGHIGGRRALSPLHQPCSPKTDEFRNISNRFLVKIKALLIDYQALINSIDTIENNLLTQTVDSKLFRKLIALRS